MPKQSDGASNLASGADPQVRGAVPEDADAIGRTHVAAWQAAYRGEMSDRVLDSLDPVRSADRWRRTLSSTDSPPLVVELDGEVVGFCVYGPTRDSDAKPSTGEVIAINVHPKAWRKGCGRVLLQAAEVALAELGYTDATLWVLKSNDRAHRFYEARGWESDGTEREQSELIGEPLREVRYRTSLNPRSSFRRPPYD